MEESNLMKESNPKRQNKKCSNCLVKENLFKSLFKSMSEEAVIKYKVHYFGDSTIKNV